MCSLSTAAELAAFHAVRHRTTGRLFEIARHSRLEGINAKIRLIQRRGFGFRDLDSLSAMIYLCLGGVTITLPTET